MEVVDRTDLSIDDALGNSEPGDKPMKRLRKHSSPPGEKRSQLEITDVEAVEAVQLEAPKKRASRAG